MDIKTLKTAKEFSEILFVFLNENEQNVALFFVN